MMVGCRWAKFRVAGIVFFAALLAACATAPVQEMSDARQAIVAAKQAGASQEAPAELAQAQHYLQNAEQALQHRDFGRARASAEKAKEAAAGALRVSRRFNDDKPADEPKSPPQSL